MSLLFIMRSLPFIIRTLASSQQEYRPPCRYIAFKLSIMPLPAMHFWVTISISLKVGFLKIHLINNPTILVISQIPAFKNIN